MNILLEALPEMEEDPKNQLLMRFCHPQKDGVEKRPLPNEVIAFLIKALKLTEAPHGGYPAVALEMGAPETLPALREAFANEQDEKVRSLIKEILDRHTIKPNEQPQLH